MPSMSTETVFLPYLNAGEALVLTLVSATVDGQHASVQWDPETCRVDLVALAAGWQEVLLEFAVAFDGSGPKSGELVLPEERGDPVVALLGNLHCSQTYRRWAAEGAWDSSHASGRIEMTVRRPEVAGAVELRALLVRTTAQARDVGLASEKGARLAWSRQWRIDVESPEQRAGPGLRTEWEEFRNSTSRWRRQHPELLFHLDTTSEEPILFINSGIDPDLQAVLKEEAPRGKKAAARDVVFAAIASSVWSSLAGEAERALPHEGLPEPGWRRNALQQIAEGMSPALSGEEALERLVKDLHDENGGAGVRERMATAILEITNLRGFAEGLVRELT
jgi:hypothetical protein